MIAEAVLLVLLAAVMARRGHRLHSLSASLTALVLLVPVSGLLFAALGVHVHELVAGAVLAIQAILTIGVVVEEVTEARLHARIAHTDRIVDRRRSASASARARAYTALQRVENTYGIR